MSFSLVESDAGRVSAEGYPAHSGQESQVLMSGLLPGQRGAAGGNSYSPSLDLLTQHGLQGGGPVGYQMHSLSSSAQGGRINTADGAQQQDGGLGARDASGLSRTPQDASKPQLCTFFLRTGTCAYADRCKFKHPLDRTPPNLNSRGYPIRPEDPDCAHYLKKGWCAFGTTCKFNHPELGTSLLGAFPVNTAAAFPNAATFPGAAFPGNTVYSLPGASVPAVYYMPSNQLGATVGSYATAMPSNAPLFQTANAGLATAGAAGGQQLFRQQAPMQATAGGYGAMGMNMMNMQSLGQADAGLPANLTKAMQNLRLGGAGGRK